MIESKMSEPIEDQILSHLKQKTYRPQHPKKLAAMLSEELNGPYPAFREAIREMVKQGRIVAGARGAILLPPSKISRDEFLGGYRHNRRGFGFVVPSDPEAKEDLFIPPGENMNAMSGDLVRVRITSRGSRDGKALLTGRVTEVVERNSKRFVGSLIKQGQNWLVMPDGNTLTEPIETPDAAGRHIKPGTKVIVELTAFPSGLVERAQGVIVDVLGQAGEKDVDLKSVIVQFNLPEEFPDAVRAEARAAVDTFDPETERGKRLNLSDEIICTIDPDDAKDYDDAISLIELDNGMWELGVHIADVSHFVPNGSALDEEAKKRGNSSYFPGFVIPMLPEVLSNGVCSLQEAVPRLCKSAFIVYDEEAKPIRAQFANTVITSRKRLRYREAQAIIDRAEVIPHPHGDKTVADYDAEVVTLLDDMNALSKRLQARRKKQGQLNLDLPEVQLVLDENGKVVDAVPEDTSFTHTLIEMFMVEANEAVARLLDSIDVPFLRRTHPTPDLEDTSRLRHFTESSGHALPKQIDRHVLQKLLETVRGKPEAFGVNMSVLKSLTRAEYSPKVIGHFALASEHYCHFTSPIRRYADLTIHRLLDAYFAATGNAKAERVKKKSKPKLENVPTYEDLVQLGRHISYTERRSEDAERELRQVKLLELLSGHVGELYDGVVSGITGFGIFVQLSQWLIDGLIRYEDLMDDWWDVDERAGVVRGQRSGKKIGIGDVVKVLIVKVDVPRRELVLAIAEHTARSNYPVAQSDKRDKNGGSRVKQRGKQTPRRRRN